MFHKKNPKKGFTIVELLVVIAIIGILTVMVIVAFGNAKEKTKIAKARVEIKQIYMAIFGLEGDTGFWPGHKIPYVKEITGGGNEICQDGCHYGINDCWTGLRCDDPITPYPGWGGPYYPEPLIDPWGNEYFFDTDYDIDPGPGEEWAVAIGSYGPNGVGNMLYDADDIILIIPSK